MHVVMVPEAFQKKLEPMCERESAKVEREREEESVGCYSISHTV